MAHELRQPERGGEMDADDRALEADTLERRAAEHVPGLPALLGLGLVLAVGAVAAIYPALPLLQAVSHRRHSAQ